jgi:hypothetical protein
MVYGYEVEGRNDQKVNVAKEMASLVSETALPGVLLVNDIPLRERVSSYSFHMAYDDHLH